MIPLQKIRPLRPATRDVSGDRVVAFAIVILAHALIFAQIMLAPPDQIVAYASSGASELRAVIVISGPHREPLRPQSDQRETQEVTKREDPQPTDVVSKVTPSNEPDAQPAQPKNFPNATTGSAQPSQSPVVAVKRDLSEPSGLLGMYRAALTSVANANWDTSHAPAGTHCKVELMQNPGGEVVSAQFTDCPFDAQARAAVERAIHKSPMPYAGFESVFGREQTIDFCHPAEACTD